MRKLCIVKLKNLLLFSRVWKTLLLQTSSWFGLIYCLIETFGCFREKFSINTIKIRFLGNIYKYKSTNIQFVDFFLKLPHFAFNAVKYLCFSLPFQWNSCFEMCWTNEKKIAMKITGIFELSVSIFMFILEITGKIHFKTIFLRRNWIKSIYKWIASHKENVRFFYIFTNSEVFSMVKNEWNSAFNIIA